VHEQQALTTRKFDCGGAERQLPIVDAASMIPTNAPSYGYKRAIDEACLISGPVRSLAAVAPID
jgi:hypothetical protein